MCGIAGLLNRTEQVEPGLLDGMLQRLAHRGPDGQGVWMGGPHNRVGLAHSRLSIIDLAGGHQPMGNEDGAIQVVFNGEIFNHIELRAELIAQGHTFRTHSDTEVIVHLYEQVGESFVDHLNGQFAIALWDGRQRRLVLARDRTGIRPLFVTWTPQGLAFASEVKALLDRLGDLPAGADQAMVRAVASWWNAGADHSVDGWAQVGVRVTDPDA